MTREDKRAYNYARDRLANDDYPVYSDEYELELAYKAGIEDAKNHPRWISVADELPKEHGAYLVFNSVSSTQDIYVYSNGNWWYNAFKCPSGVITHWMPLPKMPVLSNSENIGKDLKGGEQ